MRATVSSKGQIMIPANLRKRYGMKAGTTIFFEEDRGRLMLAPTNFEALLALGGSLGNYPLEEDLERERQAACKRKGWR